MANVIRAFEKPVADLLSDKFLFSIPSYQRPYAWTTEQAGELLDDLHNMPDAKMALPLRPTSWEPSLSSRTT
jgi:hypothetical protein